MAGSRRRINGAERGHRKPVPRHAPAPVGPGSTWFRQTWDDPLAMASCYREGFIRGRIFNQLDQFGPAQFPANRLRCGARPNRPRRVIRVFLQVEAVFAKRYEPRIEAQIALGSPDESFWPHGAGHIARRRWGIAALSLSNEQLPEWSFVNSELAEKICRSSPVVRRCWTSGRSRQRSTRAGYMPVRVPGR